MYFPPLVWNNIRDYLGIWKSTYNKVVNQVPIIELNCEFVAFDILRYPKRNADYVACSPKVYPNKPRIKYMRWIKATQKFYIGQYLKGKKTNDKNYILLEILQMTRWGCIKEDGKLYHYEYDT